MGDLKDITTWFPLKKTKYSIGDKLVWKKEYKEKSVKLFGKGPFEVIDISCPHCGLFFGHMQYFDLEEYNCQTRGGKLTGHLILEVMNEDSEIYYIYADSLEHPKS